METWASKINSHGNATTGDPRFGATLVWLPRQATEFPEHDYAQTSRYEVGELAAWHQHQGSRASLGIEPGFHGSDSSDTAGGWSALASRSATPCGRLARKPYGSPPEPAPDGNSCKTWAIARCVPLLPPESGLGSISTTARASRDDVVRGPRLALARFHEDDVDAVQAFASDPEVCRFTTWGPTHWTRPATSSPTPLAGATTLSNLPSCEAVTSSDRQPYGP
jgi:hypothetical protein